MELFGFELWWWKRRRPRIIWEWLWTRQALGILYFNDPVSEESAEDSDFSDESESEGVSEEEEESDASLGSDESSGKDWSDLEEEAAKGRHFELRLYSFVNLADKMKERDDVPDRKRKGTAGGP